MNIVYTLVGMTRGHASRALAVGAELLSRGHDVRFYTNLDAYELLTARFGFERVYEIETPKYIFSKGKIAPVQTIIRNSGFIFQREKYTDPILRTFGSWSPDVTVSDFEPLAWWISQKLCIPHITLDSQRFMLSSEMPQRLPLRDNAQRIMTQALLYLFSPSAQARIVSKQFAIPNEQATDHYVGAITRKEVDGLLWKDTGSHFLVYMKESLCSHLPEFNRIAKERGLRGVVFGIPENHLTDYPHLDYGKTSENGFLQTLSTSSFIITTPGSQTLAESWILGIPAYLLPEPNQFEQQINLHLAVQAAPQQYTRFENAETIETYKLLGREGDKLTSRGRSKAADIIEMVGS